MNQRLCLLFVAPGALFQATFAFDTPSLPLNWSTMMPCAVDIPSRVITKDVTTQYIDNTPESCIVRCNDAGFAFAGVEFSNECHCGMGVGAMTAAAPLSQCNMPCTGDPDLSCGGSFRIQIYKSPALIPGSWTLQGCFVDTPESPTFGSPVIHHTFATNLELVNQCITYCSSIGYPWAGVEAGSDCQCSFGFAAGVQAVSEEECNSLCPLPPGEGQEFCGGVQRVMAYKYSPPN
ncbi:WSC-domain-containing protein [Panus rudis PR-1116 ss-1]|nr:WSC-domain-containing protein [Panus rudis PR-1116 ss-1]